MKRLFPACAAFIGACVVTNALGSSAGSTPAIDELRRTAIVKAVEKAGPAVVNVSAERIIVVRRDPLWELFGDTGPDSVPHLQRYKTHNLGSGVIIDPDGYIVTNEHVVRRASGVYVTLASAEQPLKATLIASHSEHDIALIKIDAEQPLPTVEFGDSDQLMIGEVAIAIGNSYGLENTVTTGVVSATRRSITARGRVLFKDFIQTDAAINPGNSGGALVDVHGRLIGINTAMRYGAENIGFAIPVNKVKESLAMLLDPRQLKQIWVGIALEHNEHGHCAVAAVDEGSPANLAGVEPGDVVLTIDGRPIEDPYDYGLTIVRKGAGDRVRLAIKRGTEEKTLTLTLAAVPKPSSEDLALKRFGLHVRDFTRENAAERELNLEGGVLVTGVEKGGPADRKRLAEGDIIVRVGRFSIPNVEHLGTLLEQMQPGTEALIWVVRDDYLIGNYLTAR